MIHEPIRDADQPPAWDYLPTTTSRPNSSQTAGRSAQKLVCEGKNALAFVYDGIINEIAIELD